MTEIESPAARAHVEQQVPAAESRNGVTSLEFFLRVVVVILGIFIGIIAAFIAGFATGWIPFNC